MTVLSEMALLNLSLCRQSGSATNSVNPRGIVSWDEGGVAEAGRVGGVCVKSRD